MDRRGEGTKATGIRTATSLLTVGGYILFMVDQQGTKAGMCRGVQGAEAMAQILVWLRRWKRGELRRAGGHLNPLCRWAESWWLDILEGDLSEEEPGDLGHGCYAGGRSKRKPHQAVGEAAAQGLLSQPRPFDGRVTARVEEWLEDNLGGDKAASTERAYAGSWAKWKAWARRQELPSEYLNRKDDVVDNENKVLAFIGYLGWLGASGATIKRSLPSRMGTRRQGLVIPLTGCADYGSWHGRWTGSRCTSLEDWGSPPRC